MNTIINIALYFFSYISLNIFMFFGFIPAGLTTFWLPKTYEKHAFQFYVGLFSSFTNIFACLLAFKIMSGKNHFTLQTFIICLLPILFLAHKDFKRVMELNNDTNFLHNSSYLKHLVKTNEISLSTVVATTIGSVTGTVLWWLIFGERFIN